MCWKYENHYTHCFDLIFKDFFWRDECGLNALLRVWGVKIEKEEEFEDRFFDFLSNCHENGIINGANDTRENRLETWGEEERRLGK